MTDNDTTAGRGFELPPPGDFPDFDDADSQIEQASLSTDSFSEGAADFDRERDE